ncbi:SDR family oxidoreductase [Actinospica durhamensis]|uniref:SDR family oxidoreductase n=1 Tax=Actinospica durhamensis TaxID=1508375 RepID=A0A941EKL4_9ACTN|nr:SDR family oxidoreductase [Actinospica durhamensis]MBR7832585.1 SDR family oxidoreductase [Actinospica durhamensis]
MRVFVTGASGHIASAVIPELLAHGHQVVGLARSDASAAKVAGYGAEVRRGDLDDLEGLTAAAREADGVIHLAFNHGLMITGQRQEAAEADLKAVKALAEGLTGTGKPLVSTSGVLILASTEIREQPGTEDDTLPGGFRIDSENFAAGLAERGVRSSVVRLAPMVHSDLDKHGFTSVLIGCARENGFAAYIGEGANRWPAAHTRDAATLYRLALEKAPAGSRLHGVTDTGIPFKTIAETIAAELGVEARSVTADEAPKYLSFLAAFAGLDAPVENAKTRAVLGWEPTHPLWIEDVRSGHYFA